MSEIIAPLTAARLRFFVTDPTTGVGVTGLTHSTITTAGYATETNGVRSSTTSVTLTSTAAVTAALATGQVIEYGLGQYGIDVPAVGTSGLIFAVVTVTGKEVRAVRNQIREAAVLNTVTLTQLQAIEDGVDANTGYLTALTAALSALAAKVRKYFQLSLRKDAAIATDNAAELTELNASGGSGAGSYLSTTDSQEAIRDSIAGVISSAIASAGVATTVTGIPTFLRVGDARTVANGGAIAVRLYDADDDSLLFGLGTQLFADATITFSLRRGGNDGTEGTEDAVIPCTWVASGGDGYVRIAYEGDALDGCDAMDKLKEKDCHRWGIKFQWGDDDPITPVYGTVSVLRKIVSTQ